MTAPDLTGGPDDAAIAGPATADATTAGATTTNVAGPRGETFTGGVLADPGLRWRRLSRRSMIVRPLTDLVRLLPLVAGLLVLHTKTGGGLAWGVAASVIAVVTGLVHWATTRYLITDERVYLRRGLLNQKTLSVARDRIRTVDVTAHLLHRVLGVCRVSIGTGRNDLRSGESFQLNGVTRAEADLLRIELLTGVAAPSAEFEAAADIAAKEASAPPAAPPDGQIAAASDAPPEPGRGSDRALRPTADAAATPELPGRTPRQFRPNARPRSCACSSAGCGTPRSP